MIEAFERLFGMAVASLLGFFIGVSIYESGPVEEDLSMGQMCEAALIEFTGLQACAEHPSCQMSNVELADHYRSRKEMLIYCAADNTVKLLREVEAAKEGQTQKEEAPHEGA